MAIEEWRPVPGFEGLYEISSHGNVAAVRRQGTKGGVLRASPHDAGYRMVHLYLTNGKWLTAYIHRLVALAFIGEPGPEQVINHINGNKADNRVENLEWVSQAENGLHAYRIGLHPPRGKSLPAQSYQRARELKETGLSQSAIAAVMGITKRQVRTLVTVANAPA